MKSETWLKKNVKHYRRLSQTGRLFLSNSTKFLQHLPAQICHTPVTALKRESCAGIKSTHMKKYGSLLTICLDDIGIIDLSGKQPCRPTKWRTRRDSNARPTASEAVTLSS